MTPEPIKVINNVRTDQLERVILDWEKGGNWKLDKFASIAGDVGSSFTVVFRRVEKETK